MRLLLTGGTGFLGRVLAARLATEHELFVVTRSADAARPQGAELVVADLSRGVDRTRLPERIDGVLHVAQSRHYREFPERAEDVYAVNTAATFALLEYARRAGAAAFVLASTGSVYAPSRARLGPDTPVDPRGLYAASKYAAELLVRSYGSLLATTIARIFFLYGPGQHGMMIASLVRRVLTGEEIAIDGASGLRLTPTFVDDAAAYFTAVATGVAPGTHIVAGDEVVSLRELVTLIGAEAGVPVRVRHTDREPAGDFVADNATMRTVLGDRPLTSLRSGLRATIAAARHARG